MKFAFIILLISLEKVALSQTKGFEFLSSAKSSIESIISNYSAQIPDTSPVFKAHYLQLAKAYSKAKADYSGYRGAMKDCILDNNSKKNIQKCISSKAVNISSDLDTLRSVLETAYMEEAARETNKVQNPTYSGHNSGLITSDIIKGIMDSLLGGALKIWDQCQKYKKQYRDDYLSNLTSKDYDLAEIDDLLKKRTSPATK
jgi:hypothetical protein